VNRDTALVVGSSPDETTSPAGEGLGIAQAATVIALGNVSSRVWSVHFVWLPSCPP
jgi:hypothetical protein